MNSLLIYLLKKMGHIAILFSSDFGFQNKLE